MKSGKATGLAPSLSLSLVRRRWSRSKRKIPRELSSGPPRRRRTRGMANANSRPVRCHATLLVWTPRSRTSLQRPAIRIRKIFVVPVDSSRAATSRPSCDMIGVERDVSLHGVTGSPIGRDPRNTGPGIDLDLVVAVDDTLEPAREHAVHGPGLLLLENAHGRVLVSHSPILKERRHRSSRVGSRRFEHFVRLVEAEAVSVRTGGHEVSPVRRRDEVDVPGRKTASPVDQVEEVDPPSRLVREGLSSGTHRK